MKFRLDAKVNGGELLVFLSGNLDSLSAPELLETREQKAASERIRRVRIDCRNLRCISSAGVRVLSMIRDAAGAGNMIFLHAGKETEDILNDAGKAWIFGE